jgi:CheY-like chemotaxis protein
MSSDFEEIFQDDSPGQPLDSGEDLDPWKIMVVDDEKGVHSVTKFALKNFSFKNRKLEIISAFSGRQAIEEMQNHPDIMMILLDVVMEEDDSGLRVIKHIRDVQKNNLVRIVLRTGYPGKAPENDVILNYQITDYTTKEKLTIQRLYVTIVAALRSYLDLIEIQSAREMIEELKEKTETASKKTALHLDKICKEAKKELESISEQASEMKNLPDISQEIVNVLKIINMTAKSSLTEIQETRKILI